MILGLVSWFLIWVVGVIAGRGDQGQGAQAMSPTSASQGAVSGAQSGSQSGAQSGTVGSAESTSESTSGAQADGLNQGTVSIPECTPGALTESYAVGTVAVGSGLSIDLTATNTSQRACSTAQGQMAIRIVSGEQVIYDSSVCADHDPQANPLLFSVGDSWSTTMSWNGNVFSGCEPLTTDEGGPMVGGAGTYRVQALLGGLSWGDEKIFLVE